MHRLSAIDKIAITADIYVKEHGLTFGAVPFVIDNLLRSPIKGAPQLPAVMQNITIDDALDAVVNL